MPLWDKVKQELDRAGRVAQDALDEGKVRLEAFRVRQLADKAAQTLGYAVYHAREGGGEIDADAYARLAGTVRGHEQEASRLEAQLAELTGRRRTGGEPPPPGGAGEPAATPPDAPPPTAADAAPWRDAGGGI